ncbi:MAG TPA: cell division protein ZipA C-terminal FtsZ-binding domain-containing protein, partial [Steroidobacteraceae bacterium]|nr:cell division protein ZipA C-terminal FtsZ-binding domain-containing protein [Steroidobacteraceae bacterium]
MSELRLILLVAGGLFIAGIAGFEWWRARRDRGSASGSRQEPGGTETSAPSARTSLPDINVVREARVSVTESLPVIELSSTSASGTRRALGISISDEVAVDAATSGAGAEPPPARKQPYIGHGNRDNYDEVSEVRVYEEQPVHGPQLVIAWPKEDERRIVTLRLVPNGEPRFSGRALRQAFANAGFWHGPLDIYHLPDGQGRVIVSAAALAQPGTFDPSIMDSQRFSGLNLFSVLPGVLSERDT